MTYFQLCISFFNFFSELLLMESIFLWRAPRKKLFWLRLAGAIVVLYAFGIGLTYPFRLSQVNRTLFYVIGSLYFTVLWAASIAAMPFCFDVTVKQALVCGAAGYALQHLVSCVSETAVALIDAYAPALAVDNLNTYLTLALTVLLAVILYPALRRNTLARSAYIRMGTLCIALSVTVSCIVLSWCIGSVDRIATLVILKLYAIIACLYTLVSLFSVMQKDKLYSENKVVEQLLLSEKRQHELNQRTTEIINIKCHDLKHQIALLKGRSGRDYDSAIRELEQAVLIYDSNIKSGNDTLDLVLSEKSLLCSQYGVRFTSMLDAQKLDFMSVPDICSLFGNLFDNAFEGALREKEEDRAIGLKIQPQANTLCIRMENICTRAVTFRNGLPLSDKPDPENHGFGTKSIRYIVEKYHGKLHFYCENEKFVADILFFLP